MMMPSEFLLLDKQMEEEIRITLDPLDHCLKETRFSLGCHILKGNEYFCSWMLPGSVNGPQEGRGVAAVSPQGGSLK